MRQALQQNKARRQIAAVGNIAPPTGGWNARDPLSAMKPNEAVRLENWIPDTGGIRTRDGATPWSTGLGSAIETLMPYLPASGTGKLFAATPDKIWDATVNGPATVAKSGLGNGRWDSRNFSTTGGRYLVAVNGLDPGQSYDGTAWSNLAITGVSTGALVGVHIHVRRLWFVQSGSLSPWYLPVSAIAGAAKQFPLESFFTKGGYLLAMNSWTHDGGDGPDDYAVFVSSEGEVVVYSGTDPDTAGEWNLVGTFTIPRPIGRRCMFKAGADIGILTSQGVVPMSSMIGLTRSAANRVAITDKISGAFRTSFVQAGNLFGWSVTEYPKGNLLIVNVPVAERLTQQQFVMNTATGAWCRFTGLNAGCWAEFGADIFMGGNDGTVYRYGDPPPQPIVASLQTAYLKFNSPKTKRFMMARPTFLAFPGYAPKLYILTDYDTRLVTMEVIRFQATGVAWDEAQWDIAPWGADPSPVLPWQSVEGVGMAGSVALSIATQDIVTLNGIDVTFEAGGLL